MEFEKVKPEQDDWQEQYNLTNYDGEHSLGSLIRFSCCDDEWGTVIDGFVEWLDCDGTFEHAKERFYETMESHFESEANYYNNQLDEVRELIDRLR